MPLPSYVRRLPPGLQAKIMKFGYNRFPPFKATGARVTHIAPDLMSMQVALKLTRRSRNAVGSVFGGALFSITDGPHPIMLMIHLGPDYIVWDKAASIRYKRPCYDEVIADFEISPQEVDDLKAELASRGELDRDYTVQLKGRDGTLHAEAVRTVYIARKDFYKQKQQGKQPTA